MSNPCFITKMLKNYNKKFSLENENEEVNSELNCQEI